MQSNLKGWLAAMAVGTLALGLSPSLARDDHESGRGSASDRADKAIERAARDSARAAERASRDSQRYADERAKILRDTASDPVRQTEELAKLDADRTRELAKAQDDAAKDAADLAEDMAKAREDQVRDVSEHSDDYYENASSSGMQDLAPDERPERDARGFPVRRGEVAALDLPAGSVERLRARGFRVIEDRNLSALSARITRFGVPDGLGADAALALARQTVPEATFDYTHYYRMQFNPSGGAGMAHGATLARRAGDLRIGMIDTGVSRHPALANTRIDARDFGANGGAMPVAHGTAVASILVSEGAGRLLVANVFRGGGHRPYTSADALVGALEWMAANHVPVVNMSLAGPRNAILDRLIAASARRGTIIVAAAGNGGPTAPPAYPAALSPVIAVTAVDAAKRVYRYANQGSYITVAARGVSEPAAQSGGGIGLFTGTSFATPHVAAWLARCLGRANGTTCSRELRDRAEDLGKPGFDTVYGYGLIR